MRSHYLCAYHAERLRACESEAFRYWGEMMRRGVQAYVECRVDAAVLYLGTALEIGLLRHRCRENGIFAAMHIRKPAEFLQQLLLMDRQHAQVKERLERLSTHLECFSDSLLESFLNDSLIKLGSAPRATVIASSPSPALLH